MKIPSAFLVMMATVAITVDAFSVISTTRAAASRSVLSSIQQQQRHYNSVLHATTDDKVVATMEKPSVETSAIVDPTIEEKTVVEEEKSKTQQRIRFRFRSLGHSSSLPILVKPDPTNQLDQQTAKAHNSTLAKAQRRQTNMKSPSAFFVMMATVAITVDAFSVISTTRAAASRSVLSSIQQQQRHYNSVLHATTDDKVVATMEKPSVETSAIVDPTIEEKTVVEEEKSKTQQLMQQVKDAGLAGVISYAIWELGFWTISVPVCAFGYYEVTGHWPDLTNADDQAKLAAEAFAFVNFARFAVPLRIGLALSTTPWMQKNIVDKFIKKNDANGEMEQ
eukprot:CAMPEP_0119571588 /NCGR_PEP_ID=MMETSP1352-20130426/44195_1 /TAXON_ID=265584 /ORGANISM="Stauroneis constricta, Strain CCMP1120" /LENGTH=335 /DNA_ID=CAMNT_0007621271 /DNA_START=150 /DNA_END=1156 /DNA_ORIENTATION=+